MARVNDLQALCRNDVDLTYLQLLRPETDTTPLALARLVRGIKTNTNIERVRVFVPQDFFLRRDGDNDTEGGGSSEEGITWVRRRLFQAVGSLPKLVELKIDAYSGMATFPLELLSQTVMMTQHLKELELWDLKLTLDFTDNVHSPTATASTATTTNRKNDYYYSDVLNFSLQNHPNLERFTLYNCQLRENSICNNLDALLHALATCPKLRQVYVTAAAAASSDASSSVSFTRAALEDLCRSKSLQELGLWKFNFPLINHPHLHHHHGDDNDDAAASSETNIPNFRIGSCSCSCRMDPLTLIAPAVAQTNVLKMLEFGKCYLTQEGDEALAAMLRVNTSLVELDLHLDSSSPSSSSSSSSFSSSTTLRGRARENNNGNNHDPNHDDDTGGSSLCQIVATAKALEFHNRTLKRIKLWGLLDRRNQEALVRMIRNNYVLETCRLLDADRDISAEIDFYLARNREGRQYFLTTQEDEQEGNNEADEEVAKGLWANLFSESDLSTIYYYLSMKPNLCQMMRIVPPHH